MGSWECRSAKAEDFTGSAWGTSAAVYACIASNHVGAVHADVPLLAATLSNGKNVTVAVGRDAALIGTVPGMRVDNGFKHPRTLLADFTLAQQVLAWFLGKVKPASLFAVSPTLVIHPQALLDGGLTQIERRAWAELGLGAGARKVFVWTGCELTAEQLRTLTFPVVGGCLEYP